MRLLLILFFAAFSLSVFAQAKNWEIYDWWDSSWEVPGWHFYYNRNLGYSLDILPNFSEPEEKDDGNWIQFLAKQFSAKLVVWSDFLHMSDGDFGKEVSWRIASDIERGWNISYHAIQPQSVSYSGLNSDNSRILYQRMITVCDSKGYAAFRLEYDRADRARFDSIIKRLVATFKENQDVLWGGPKPDTVC